MKKTVCTILILIFTGIFALGAFQIYRQLREYDEGAASYTDIEQYVSHQDPEDNQNEEQDETWSGEEPETNWPSVDFAALAEINPDIVAWIYIEDTEQSDSTGGVLLCSWGQCGAFTGFEILGRSVCKE